ncbi:Nucleoside diphosphate kinase 6 [Aphelenchoides fujianensis]|nr:Nucleoside diphosphate kinase 6 [Aphelenchoides fujianensis]
MSTAARTFAILKPDLVAYPQLANDVLDRILGSSLRIRRAARLRIRAVEAERLYAEHAGRFYYGRLIRHICSGPAVLLEMSGSDEQQTAVDPVAEWRRLIGPSKFLRGFGTAEANGESIRWRTALSDVRNSVHGADSPASVQREAAIFDHELQPVDDAQIRRWLRFEAADPPEEPSDHVD